MAVSVHGYPLGQYQTNCYVVRSTADATDAVVVDPGSEGPALIAELDRLGIRPVAILVTHVHFDHIGAVADLAEAYGCPVSMCADEAYGLEHPDAVFPNTGVRPWVPELRLAGDETFTVAGITFETVRVPGHSPAHIAFHADGCLFSGDVLFAGSVGRTDLPGASWDALQKSIRLLVDRFPAETIVYSGHGAATTLGHELGANPFLAEIRAEREARQERTA